MAFDTYSQADSNGMATVVHNLLNTMSREPSEDAKLNIQRMSALLAKKLGPEYLSSRQGAGGSKMTYIEGWRCIALANEVFGFNGWSSEIRELTLDFCDYHEESQRFSAAVTARVRITLSEGTYHEDVGCGKIENCKSKADALDKIKKEAVTDATKRALRNFGNVLGNCLYDKNFLDNISKVKAPGKEKLDFNDLHRPSKPNATGTTSGAGGAGQNQQGPAPVQQQNAVAGPSNMPQRPQPVQQQQNAHQRPNGNAQYAQRQQYQPQQAGQRYNHQQQQQTNVVKPPAPGNPQNISNYSKPGVSAKAPVRAQSSEEMFAEFKDDDMAIEGEADGVPGAYDDSGFYEEEGEAAFEKKAGYAPDKGKGVDRGGANGGDDGYRQQIGSGAHRQQNNQANGAGNARGQAKGMDSGTQNRNQSAEGFAPLQRNANQPPHAHGQPGRAQTLQQPHFPRNGAATLQSRHGGQAVHDAGMRDIADEFESDECGYAQPAVGKASAQNAIPPARGAKRAMEDDPSTTGIEEGQTTPSPPNTEGLSPSERVKVLEQLQQQKQQQQQEIARKRAEAQAKLAAKRYKKDTD